MTLHKSLDEQIEQLGLFDIKKNSPKPVIPLEDSKDTNPIKDANYAQHQTTKSLSNYEKRKEKYDNTIIFLKDVREIDRLNNSIYLLSYIDEKRAAIEKVTKRLNKKRKIKKAGEVIIDRGTNVKDLSDTQIAATYPNMIKTYKSILLKNYNDMKTSYNEKEIKTIDGLVKYFNRR